MDEIARSPDDFANAFESAFAHLQVRVEEACTERPDWATAVAAAIRSAFEFAAVDQPSAWTLTNDALAAGPDGIARHRRLLAYLGDGLARGRRLSPGGEDLPPSTEQALAGGLVGLVAERLTRGRAAELPTLARDAIQFALTPYLGMAEAKRVAEMSDWPPSQPAR